MFIVGVRRPGGRGQTDADSPRLRCTGQYHHHHHYCHLLIFSDHHVRRDAHLVGPARSRTGLWNRRDHSLREHHHQQALLR